MWVLEKNKGAGKNIILSIMFLQIQQNFHVFFPRVQCKNHWGRPWSWSLGMVRPSVKCPHPLVAWQSEMQRVLGHMRTPRHSNWRAQEMSHWKGHKYDWRWADRKREPTVTVSSVGRQQTFFKEELLNLNTKSHIYESISICLKVCFINLLTALGC